MTFSLIYFDLYIDIEDNSRQFYSKGEASLAMAENGVAMAERS